MTVLGWAVIAFAVGSVAGCAYGVRVRAREVERSVLAMHAASLEAQAAAIESAAAALVVAERERYDARLRGLIEMVAPLVQGDIEHNAHGGQAVVVAQALYAAQQEP